MRVFISLELPEIVKKEIVKIQKIFSKDFSGKITSTKNLHLTLKFIGEISEETVEKIKEKLRKIKFNEFSAEIDSVGVFSEDFIRIFWVHLNGCSELQKAIDEELSDLFEKEKRFMSHITIARIKNCDKDEFLSKIKSFKVNPVKFIVKDFYLKNSVLKSDGPTYFTIEKFSAG